MTDLVPLFAFTLREAIIAAYEDQLADAAEGVQAGSGADVMRFDESLRGGRIELVEGELMITDSVTENNGDFNGDGRSDCEDVGELTSHLADQTYRVEFDMNGDGVLNQGDIGQWLIRAGARNIGATYLRADADLNGRVDSADLGVLGINWQQSDSFYCHGDFDGSGFVDARDLNFLAQNWQMSALSAQLASRRSPRAALAWEDLGPVDRVADIAGTNEQSPRRGTRSQTWQATSDDNMSSKPYFAIHGISRRTLAHGLWREPDANACRLIQGDHFSTNHEMWFSRQRVHERRLIRRSQHDIAGRRAGWLDQFEVRAEGIVQGTLNCDLGLMRRP